MRQWKTIAAIALSATMLAATAQGQSAKQSIPKAGPLDKAAVEKIVRDYLRDNPEIVIEAIEAWREKQRLTEAERAKKALVAERAALFDNPNSPVAGNPKGDVTVVEFFDYQCGYCKRVMPGFMKTVEQDGQVRIVFKEFPILGPASIVAARAALAARAQGKYFEFHRELMALKTGLSEVVIMTIARAVGLDVKRLKKDMEAPEVQREIAANLALADRLGIRGTPAFVFGEKLIPGAINVDRMKSLIAEARKAKG